MFKAVIDTPWDVDANGDMVPKLVIDPAYADQIKSSRDVTGEQGFEVAPGRILFGGNYPKSTGIQPDYSIGRLGGSGDPDWLTIEVVTETNIFATIDAEQDYQVMWSEEIEEGPEVMAATLRGFTGAWNHFSGVDPSTPATGESYFRVPSELLRISKTDADGNDRTAELEALKRPDLIQQGIEEYWEVRNILIAGTYVELEVADLQKGPSGAPLSDGRQVLEFDTSGMYHKPGNRPGGTEWDAIRAKLNGRGYPPGWVDNNLGTNREKLRTEHDLALREGYVLGQV